MLAPLDARMLALVGEGDARIVRGAVGAVGAAVRAVRATVRAVRAAVRAVRARVRAAGAAARIERGIARVLQLQRLELAALARLQAEERAFEDGAGALALGLELLRQHVGD